VRHSLRTYYKTSVIKRVCAETGISEKTIRGFFYRKTQLKAFDMIVILYTYDFIRDSVGLAQINTNNRRLGNKSGEQIAKSLLNILKNNKELTFRELGQYLGIKSRKVEYYMNKLKRMNLLRRTGARKNGKWIVI
jgi:Fic family protein